MESHRELIAIDKLFQKQIDRVTSMLTSDHFLYWLINLNGLDNCFAFSATERFIEYGQWIGRCSICANHLRAEIFNWTRMDRKSKQNSKERWHVLYVLRYWSVVNRWGQKYSYFALVTFKSQTHQFRSFGEPCVDSKIRQMSWICEWIRPPEARRMGGYSEIKSRKVNGLLLKIT